MINKVILIGRLTKAPEIRKTANGNTVANFTLAVGRSRAREGSQDADFITCVAWNRTAELMMQYLNKGSLIGIEGQIQTSSYTNSYNQTIYRTDVVADIVQFLDKREASLSNDQPMGTQTNHDLDLPY